MRKKIVIGILITILIVGCGYFIFNATRYNNIIKIEADIVNNVTLTDKKDIRLFMECMNSKKRVKEPVFIFNTSGKKIPNDVKITYKNGKTKTFLMTMDYPDNELFYSSDASSVTAYKISPANTKKIIDLLNKNK
jgi:uncharacterized protein YxeA